MKKLSLLVSFVLVLVLATSVMAADEPVLSIDFANGDNGMELVNADLVEDPTRGQVLKINGQGPAVKNPDTGKANNLSYALLNTTVFEDNTWEEGMTLAMWIKTDVGSQTLTGTTPIWSIDIAGKGYFSVICSMEGTINSDGNDTSYGITPRVWNDPVNVSGGVNATEEGVWQHLVMVYSPEGQYLYLDGELVNEPKINSGWSMDDCLFQLEFAHALRLGGWLCDWWNQGDYQGMIDDVVLYNVAMDQSDVKELAKASKIEQTVFEEAPALEDLYDGTKIDPVYVNNFDDASTVELVEAAIVTDAAQGNAVEINGAGSGANNVSYGLITTDLFANTDWTNGFTISLKAKADASETLTGMAPLYSLDIARIGYIGAVTSLQSGINTDGNEDVGISPRLWNDPADRDNCKSKLTAGQWQTVTVVYDSTGMAIYLDGECVLKPGINNGAYADLAAQLQLVPAIRLGAWNCDWWKYGDFEGLIDDVTIWNATLNPLQVKNFVEGVAAEPEVVETEAPVVETEPEVVAPVETEAEVVAPVETEAEVVAPAETEAEVVAPAEPEAPQTFDLGIAAIAAAVLSLGTALVSKKRR